MPNYGLVTTAQFRPFSYDEYAKPAMQATEVHRQIEDAYGALAAKADEWRQAALNAGEDSKAFSMYSKYADDLQNAADDLLKNGLNGASRSKLWNMNRRYNSEITPIQKAYEKWQSDIALQDKMAASDGTLIYQNARESNLDKYLENMNPVYEKYSGEQLRKMSKDAASALADELVGYGQGKKINEYTDSFIKQRGYSKYQVDKVAKVLRGQADVNTLDTKELQILNNLAESVLQSSNITKWANADQIQQAKGYIIDGLWDAVGKSDVSPMENWKARYDVQHPAADDTELPKDKIWGYEAPTVNAEKSTSGKTIESDIKTLQSIKSAYGNQSIPEYAEGPTTVASTSYFMPVSYTDGKNPMYEKEQALFAKYGVSNRQELETALQYAKNNNVELDRWSYSNRISGKQTSAWVSRRIASGLNFEDTDSTKSGLYKLNAKGKVVKLDKNDVDTFSNEKAVLHFNPMEGDHGLFRLSVPGKSTIYIDPSRFSQVVAPVVVPTPTGKKEVYFVSVDQLTEDIRRQYTRTGKLEDLNAVVDAIWNALNADINSMTKDQSVSDKDAHVNYE